MSLFEKIKRLRELSEKATAGPWQSSRDRMVFEVSAHVKNNCTTVATLGVQLASEEEILEELNDPKVFDRRWDDAEFIAASRTALPKLCDELEKAVDILKFIHKELGVPQPRYPEPVAHASDVAAILLKEWGVE